MIAPPKVMQISVIVSTPTVWDQSDGPYAWYPLEWSVTLSVTPQVHGYTDTNAVPPISMGYDGTHIIAGMWMATNNGMSFRIKEVTTSTNDQVVVVIEDVNGYTLYANAGQTFGGVGTLGLLFQLDTNGHPLIDPFPKGFFDTDGFGSMMDARLRAMGITTTPSSGGTAGGGGITDPMYWLGEK